MRRNSSRSRQQWLQRLLLMAVPVITIGMASVVQAGGLKDLTWRSSSSQDEPSVDGQRGHHLMWEEITFAVPCKSCARPGRISARKGRRERILVDVSGEALPGRLLAILGPSGCGKSSLLNALAGRVPAAKHNRLEGTVEVGGIPLRDFDTQRYVAYVRQQQDYYSFLTVRETLLITAGLRLDRSVSHSEREVLVWDIIEKLGLSQAADTLVGDLRTPGISGGEKRRLAMGLQLVGLEAPSIIFLDEPTSGLDSHQALQVMATVRDLCAEGHTVVVAIHQPRSSIYALFDDILLLSEGVVMYHGSKEDVLPRLASLGHKCPVNFNPADFMVDLISPVSNGNGPRPGDEKATEAKERGLAALAESAKRYWSVKSAERRARSFQQDDGRHWWTAGTGDESEEQEEEDVVEDVAEEEELCGKPERISKIMKRQRGGGGVLTTVPASSSVLTISEPSKHRRRSGWPTQFGLLLRRSWRQATRDKFAAVARVAMGFGLGGVFGSIFWKLGLQESSIQNRVSLFVNVAMNTAMFGCIRALQTLAVEKGVVALERMDQGYSASAYLASKILAEFPMDTIFPLIFGTTIYMAAGLNKPIGGGVKLAKFLGTLLVQAHASSALGLMVGCISPSMEVANLTGPAIIVISLMLSGVHDDIPPYLKKLETMSTINWGIQGIVTNEMRDLKFVPDGKRILMGWKFGTDREVIPGEDVMEKMGFRGEGLQKPTMRLLQLTAGFHAVTLINLFLGIPKFQRMECVSHAQSTVSGGGREKRRKKSRPSHISR